MKKIAITLFLSILSLCASQSFLMPDEAFSPQAKLNESMQIEAKIVLAEDIYLYENEVKLTLKNTSGISIKEIKKSKSVEHEGSMVYEISPKFLVTLQKDKTISGMKNIEFELSYQGCSSKGLCYEPLTKAFNFDIDTSKLSDATSLELKSLQTLTQQTQTNAKESTKTKPPKEVKLSQTDSIANTISSGSIGLIILTFLGFGILLALTPCVFPMIPIISGIIVSHGKNITTKKAFFLSLVYVLAMAVAYTIAGILAGLFGSNLQSALQTPWVIYSFSGVFVALAMSMFGFYELKLPDAFVAKISGSRNKSGVVGVALMGFLSALIVGPCVAAPLAGALVYIGQTGDAFLGGMALFAMGIGMGLPLIVVGVSAGKFMPKPGMWMTMVSTIFGVMMLGVAIWMLQRVVDEYITMILWASLGLGFSIYLGAFEKESHVFKRSISIIIFIYSVALFTGALGGSSSMSKPLEFLKPQASISLKHNASEAKFQTVDSITELDALLKRYQGKKIMLDFSADWCTSCRELEEVTFAHPDVKTKMSEFVLLRADITDNSEAQKALSKKYGVFGPPAIIFFDEESQVQKSKTIIGFIEAEKFLEHLKF